MVTCFLYTIGKIQKFSVCICTATVIQMQEKPKTQAIQCRLLFSLAIFQGHSAKKLSFLERELCRNNKSAMQIEKSKKQNIGEKSPQLRINILKQQELIT